MAKNPGIISLAIGLATILMSCGPANDDAGLFPVPEMKEESSSNGKQPIREIYLEGGRTGIMLIHGYAASSLTMKPMAYALHQCGYTVYCVLLPGHGTEVKDLDAVRKKDYYNYIEKAYRKFSQKVDNVFVVGHSLGSLLAIHLSVNHRLGGVVLMSPPLLVLGEKTTKEQVHNAAVMIGTLLSKLPRPNPAYLKEPDYFKRYGIYSEFSTSSLEVLVEVIRDARANIGKVKEPTLIILGYRDPLVDVRTGDFILGKMKNRNSRQTVIDSYGHRYFLGDKMPAVVKEIDSFIRSINPKESSTGKSN